LTRLAVAALDHFQIEPRLLHLRPTRRGADALDRGDRAVADRTDRQQAGADGFAVEVHRAGAALRDAATELRTGHAEHVAQRPEQRCVAVDIDHSVNAVNLDRRGHGYLRGIRLHFIL